MFAEQRQFFSRLHSTDPRITTHEGRIEKRPYENLAATALRRYLGTTKKRLDPRVYSDLMNIAKEHSQSFTLVEKAVDVGISVDMVVMAHNDEYDAAYLLSADGDFTPAVTAVRAVGKKVYAASPAYGAALANVVNTFIPLPHDWFDDCYS